MKCNMFKDGWQCKRNANHEGACAMECVDYEPDDYEKLFNLMGTLKGEDWTEIIEMFPELKKQMGANHEDSTEYQIIEVKSDGIQLLKEVLV